MLRDKSRSGTKLNEREIKLECSCKHTCLSSAPLYREEVINRTLKFMLVKRFIEEKILENLQKNRNQFLPGHGCA